MSGFNRGTPGRIALAGLVAVALGVASCGGSDGDDAPSPASADRADGKAEMADLSPREREVHETYAELVKRFYAKDAEGVCGLMTRTARKRQGSDVGQSCSAWFTALWSRGPLGEHKPSIVRLRFSGSKALARVKSKTSNVYPVEFTKEDGDWKVSKGM